MMGNRELFWSQCRGIGLNLQFIWATPIYFTFLQWHQCSCRLVRDFWGTLCNSFKQIKAPYLFDSEQGVALHAVQGNQASSFSERKVWWFFSSCIGMLGYVLKLRRGKSLKTFDFFSDVRTHISLWWTPQESKLCLTGQYGRFWRWGKRQRFTF